MATTESMYIRRGINIIANTSNVSGLGIAFQSLITSLEYAHIPITVDIAKSLLNSPPQDQHLSYPVSLLGFNIDYIAGLRSYTLTNLIRRTYTIADWTYELSQIPQALYPSFRDIDEIWVPSQFIQQSMEQYAQCPVHIVPYPVVLPDDIEKNRVKYDIPPDRFMFLFTFSVSSTEARKNPFAVVEAFQQAFGYPNENDPILVIKAQNIDQYPMLLEDLSQAISQVGGILIRETLSRDETWELLNTADCYISLHRSEGFGLGMAESMYLGKPVIATGYSGNVDFMNENNSYLVSFKLRKISYKDHVYVPESQNLYPIGFEWAEPDIQHAASLMKCVFQNQHEARAKGEVAAQYIQQTLSYEKIGKMVYNRINDIYDKGTVKRDLHYSLLNQYSKGNQNQFLYRYISQYQEQTVHITSRYRQLLSSWETAMHPAHNSPLYRIPVLGRGLYLLKRVLWQGKLNIEQSLVNQINLEQLEQHIHALSGFMYYLSNRVVELDEKLSEYTSNSEKKDNLE